MVAQTGQVRNLCDSVHSGKGELLALQWLAEESLQSCSATVLNGELLALNPVLDEETLCVELLHWLSN